MVCEEIIIIYFVELEVPWLDIWSMNCCWYGKGFVSTAGVGLVFKNLLISSRRGHSFVKWSPPLNRQGCLAFLFPLLSFSVAESLVFSSWFLGFLFFPLPFFLLPGVWVLWIAFTLVENAGVEGAVVELIYACQAWLIMKAGLNRQPHQQDFMWVSWQGLC